MEQILIVDYTPAYAGAIADMWNASGDGWNGRIFNKSEARVLQDEASASYLNLYLSVQGGQVLGYAKLTDYVEEAGVAYIELLNVLPSHHGMGIGRDLVKRCVLRAAELGYDRIDLFTWAGNTKAVPLYKKCGFFWEKMDNQSTHLMNFIPGLLNMELLKPWWNVFDWYEHSIRELKIEPDGRADNGFDIYDYVWEKDGQRLEISFERFGRGIVALQTPDMSVAISTTCPKPVFGIPVQIDFELRRLSGNPKPVSVEGVSDGIIRHEFRQESLLEESLRFSSECFPGPLERKLTEWETCPRARCVLKVDNTELPLALGLKVQYPLSAEIRLEDSLMFPGREYRMFLNLRNQYANSCQFQVEIPNTQHVTLKENHFALSMEGGARQFLELSFSARQACVYSPRVSVTAHPEGSNPISFEIDCGTIIEMPTGRHGVDSAESLQLINGLNTLRMYKVGRKNYGWVGRLYANGISLMCPLAGKPYSEELESILPYETNIIEDPLYIEAECRFRSRDIPGFHFAWIYRLWDSGLVEVFPRVLSRPEGRNDLWLKLPISIYDGRLSFLYKGRIMETDSELLDLGMCDLPRECPEENWLFGKTSDGTICVIWPEDTRLAPERYWLAWEVNLDYLHSQGLDAPKPLQIHLDVFKNAWQLRNAARGRKQTKPITQGLELTVNGGNPVLNIPCRAEIVQSLDMELLAGYHVQSSCIADPAILSSPTPEDGLRVLGWDIAIPPAGPLEMITAKVELPYSDITRGQMMLYPTGECSFSEDGNMLTCDNGVLCFGAARDARLPGLLSLRYNGTEVLDANYPDYPPKSFYNPYPGGLAIKPGSIGNRALMAEQHLVESASLSDQFGNLWQGLGLRTSLRHFDPLNGLQYRQLYLTLPGVPVLLALAEIVDNGGAAKFIGMDFTLSRILSTDVTEDAFMLQGKDGQWQTVRHCANEVFSMGWYNTGAIILPGGKDYLQLCGIGEMRFDLAQDPSIAQLNAELYTRLTDVVPQRSAPVVMLFSKELYPKSMLRQLLSLEF